MFDQKVNAVSPRDTLAGFGPMQPEAFSNQGNVLAAESEIVYAARCASESLARLEASTHQLAAMLEKALRQDPNPRSPETEKCADRHVSAPMATALMQHSRQIDSLERFVTGVMDRVAL